jgi:hypothetical protein
MPHSTYTADTLSGQRIFTAAQSLAEIIRHCAAYMELNPSVAHVDISEDHGRGCRGGLWSRKEVLQAAKALSKNDCSPSSVISHGKGPDCLTCNCKTKCERYV